MSNDNAYLKAREEAERTSDPQERNRVWWETLPMTYAGWDEADRIPVSPEEFANVETAFLEGNPWLRDHYDFSAMAGKDVLEIGCGTGVAACLFAKNGARVTAVDLTAQAIDIATRNAAAQELTNVQFIQMDAEKLQFPDASFDHVFSWGVLHHSAHTEDAIKQVGRVLRPGGTGLIMVYNKASLRFWGKGFKWLWLKGKIFKGYNMQTVQGFSTDGYYQRHFGHGELKRILANAGLKTTEIAVSHMAKRYTPFFQGATDEWMKRKWGWLLTALFVKE